ncbi:DEAD/DEAH box helicase [Methanocaldococcus sp.]
MEKVLNILKDFGIKELRPPQKKALDRGLLDNKNFLISIPTASGKTLIGEMALINHLLDDNKKPTGKKGIFIVPLKALASEKYEEFKNKYEKYGLRVALSIGDYSEEEDLSNYDLIITTSEKLDSLWRHKIPWINDVSVVVVDEIHLINDESRGGTLEILLTKLKELDIQIIGLSATIGNPEELAEWLNAELIVDDWRPVELKKGIYKDGVIEYLNGSCKRIKVESNDIYSLVVDCIKDGGSCLIFCNTKKGAVNEAKKLNLKKFLTDEEKMKLKEISEEILSILEPPTEMCKTLAECILNGVAFHHAGLTYQHRKIVETAFRERLIKVICCTPTLCLNANTEILQESGFKKITELNKNEKVFALCGKEIKPVNGWKVHKTPQHEYNIVVRTVNGLEITTTPNHIFLVKNGKEICEKEARELKVGDYVATVDKIRIKEKDIGLSNGDLYFIGYFIGDGYTGVIEKNVFKATPDLAFNPKYPPNFDDSELHKKYFLKCRISKGVAHYRYSKKLRKIFNKLNLLTKDNKNIDAFCNLPLEKLSYLIAGLFDSDGYINLNRKNIEFYSISEKLIKKLQFVLLRFGIHSSIRKKKTKCKDIYVLTIRDFISIKRFYENIPLRHKEKRRKLEEIIKSKEIAKIWCDCGFKVDLTMFKPRTKNQEELNKKRVKLLFELLNGKKLVTNYKDYYSKRKNSHFDFIIREKVGGNKKGVYYSLNDKGRVLMNLLDKNIKDKENLEEMYNFLANLEKCPVCGKPIHKEMRHSWKKECYDGDIYWSKIKEIKKIKVNDKYAYDIELPDDGSNSHYIVANGFIVHNSAGLNLPCRRVIVKDLMRYTNRGLRYIPIMEVQQCIGRAGRPGLDPYGEGIIIAKGDRDYLRAYQILTQKPEPIYSKLSNQHVLRTQLLGLISTGYIKDEYDLESFIKNTFYAYQYGNLREVAKNIYEVINFLEENEFIVDFVPTELGKRISELYIDPLSAKYIIDGLKEMEREEDLYYLYLVSKTLEMMPNLRVYRSEEFDLISEMEYFGIKNFDIEDLEAFKTAKMLYDWINEIPEEKILKKYKIEPGILRYKVENAVWIMHALKEISKILNKNTDIPEKLEIRLEYGAKEDIIEILNIKYIGRVRARKLYNAGIKSIDDIINNPSKVAQIIGEKITKKILNELGVKYGQQKLL